jgi:hypothetical protein
MDMGYGEKLQLAVIAEGGKRHLVSPHLADLPDRTGQANLVTAAVVNEMD